MKKKQNDIDLDSLPKLSLSWVKHIWGLADDNILELCCKKQTNKQSNTKVKEDNGN